MKKFAFMVMALAMTSFLYGKVFTANTQPGEVYFSQEQFDAPNPGTSQILTTFPLIYKGTLKIDGVSKWSQEFKNSIKGNSCAVTMLKPSLKLYMTMCIGNMASKWCQSMNFPMDNDEDSPTYGEIKTYNYNTVSETAYTVAQGITVPAMTQWNLYIQVPSKDVLKTCRAHNIDLDSEHTYYLSNTSYMIFTEDLMPFAFGDAESVHYRSIQTGAEKENATIFWQDYEINNWGGHQDVRKFAATTGAEVYLIAKKGVYSFRACPGSFGKTGITDDEKDVYAWSKTGSGKRTETVKIPCFKSISGNVHSVQVYGAPNEDPDADEYLTYGFTTYNGTMKLTLNSLTKTVANKIFGHDAKPELNADGCPYPTICEEGLALRNKAVTVDPELNTFEEAAFGKNKNKLWFITNLWHSAGGVAIMRCLEAYCGQMNIPAPEDDNN